MKPIKSNGSRKLALASKEYDTAVASFELALEEKRMIKKQRY